MGPYLNDVQTISRFFDPPPPCHCHTHTSHQYFCLLFGYPLPSKRGRHLSIAPMAKTLPSLWRHCKFLWRIAARGREGLIDCQLPRENEDINACASVQNKRSAARGILAWPWAEDFYPGRSGVKHPNSVNGQCVPTVSHPDTKPLSP